MPLGPKVFAMTTARAEHKADDFLRVSKSLCEGLHRCNCSDRKQTKHTKTTATHWSTRISRESKPKDMKKVQG